MTPATLADVARASKVAAIEGWCRLHDWGRDARVAGDTVLGLLDMRSSGEVQTVAVPVVELRAWAGY